MSTSAFAIADHNAAASAPRQYAAKLAMTLGFSETRAGQLALIASELATNIAKHAGGGQILVHAVASGDERGIEILALDKGPGMPTRANEEGYSTAGSLGAGLGVLRRQADEFELFSQPGLGTVAVARVWKRTEARPPRTMPSGINVPKAGESVSGDAWAYHDGGRQRSYLLVDGLGHGPHAADAAEAAVSVYRQRAHLSPTNLIEEIHQALRATRGAAVAVAALDVERDVLHFAGVGNIVAAMLTADRRRQSLASHNGTAGLAMRRIQEFSYAVHPGAVLVMHSDGLATHWTADAYPDLWSRDPALIAGVLYRDHTRGRDDATVIAARLRE